MMKATRRNVVRTQSATNVNIHFLTLCQSQRDLPLFGGKK